MTFSLFRPMCAAIIVTTLSISTLTQKADSKKAVLQAQPPAGSKNNQERALALVDLILIASSKFSDDWLRLKTQNRIAETLWDYDKTRARRLFEEVFKGAGSLESKVGQGAFISSAPELVEPLRFEMRKEILQSVSKRDAELAEKLAASIQSAKPDRNLNAATRQLALDRELVEHNLAVALNIADSDPQRAARLARDSLNRRISSDFTKLIRSMRPSNPELADQLFLDALAALQRKPIYISNKIGVLAPYVFPETDDEPGEHSDGPVNPEMVTRFLDLIYDAVTRLSTESQVNENSPFGTSSFDHGTLQAILPHFEKQSPARAAVVRSLIDEIVKKINQAGRKDMWDGEDEAWREMFRSKITDLVAKAEAAANKEEADELYSEAAMVLTDRDNQFDKALLLIEKISDKQKRTLILAELRTSATNSATERGETEQAYRYARGITDLETQVRAFQEIATKMIDKKETEKALEVVNETARLIPHLSDKSSRAEAFLILAAVATRLSAAKGFDVMQSAVEAINHAEFGPHWSDQTIYTDTKASKSSEFEREVSGLERLDFSGSLLVLARADFNRALALAQTIKMKEASLLAQLAVCLGVLTPSNLDG